MTEGMDDLLNVVRRFPVGPHGIALGGSHAKGTADAQSDLDIYVFSAGVMPNAERTAALKPVLDSGDWITSYGCGEPFQQGGTDFSFHGKPVEIWFRSTAWIDSIIAACREGRIERTWANWTMAGFHSHTCLSDLSTMRIVDDPQGILAGWKEQLRKYPAGLGQAISRQSLGGARFWCNSFHYTSAVERQDVLYCSGIVQHVIHDLIQLLFALNRRYYPGDKNFVRYVAHLPIQPERFTERVEALLFVGSATRASDLRRQREDLRTLLAETEILLDEAARHGDPTSTDAS